MNKRMILILIAVIGLMGSYLSVLFSGAFKQPEPLEYTPNSLKPVTTQMNFTGKIMDFYPYISFALVSNSVNKDYLEKVLVFPEIINKTITVTLNPYGSGYFHKIILYSNDTLRAGFRTVFRTYKNFTVLSPPTRKAIVYLPELNVTTVSRVLYSRTLNQSLNFTCVVEKLGNKVKRVLECYDTQMYNTNIFGIPDQSFFILQPVTVITNVSLVNVTDKYVVDGTYNIFSYMAENQSVVINNTTIKKGRIPLSIQLDFLPENLSGNYSYRQVNNSTYRFEFTSMEDMRKFVEKYNLTPPSSWFRTSFSSKNYTKVISSLNENGYNVTSIYRIGYFIPPEHVVADNQTIEIFYREPTEIQLFPDENRNTVKAELNLGMKYREVLSITAREIQ